ncbi:MAG: putative Alpha/beta hydrolase fold [Gemmatimonadetes bacterium]|nr:putative Alpha/beta hydrolase fold [Gemmatimonadota bacterium]
MRLADLTVLHAQPAHATRPPVLFVHGYFADASVWAEWLPFFAARGFPAYAVHLRGRGGSMPNVDLGRVSIEDFVRDAAAVATHLGTPAVVGHSMGGLIAQRLAEDGLAAAAVLVTPAPPRGIMVLTARVAIKQLKYLPWILTSRVVAPRREDLREIVLNRVPAELQNGMLDKLIPDSGRAARDMSITGVPVSARRVRCPTLVIAADEDRFIPKPVVERIAKRYAAPLQTMVGHGHMVINEPGWETTADTVARWLSERG